MHTSRPEGNEAGFGLVELLIAMVILNVGLLAIVAAFSSGAVAIKRAGKIATAASLADAQMEQYRALTYDAIGLDTSATTDTLYLANRPVDGSGTPLANVAPTSPNSCASGATLPTSFPNACVPSRAVNASTTPASPDRLSYRVDTYVNLLPATSSQRATKLVTVIVRDAHSAATLGGLPLAREASTFDCSTGQIPTAPPC